MFLLCSSDLISSSIPTGIDEPLLLKKRKAAKPGFTHSPWKSAYIRQHRIDTNWRRGDLKSPKVGSFISIGFFVVVLLLCVLKPISAGHATTFY